MTFAQRGAEVVAVDLAPTRLTPGGVLVISEHHPLWEILTVTGMTMTVTGDYFTPGRDGYADPLKAPQITRELKTPLTSRSYVWNLGAVVSAVLGAGLTLRSLREFAAADMYAELGPDAKRLPATYLLTAAR